MTTDATSRLVLPMSERDHIRGPATAPASLVEYGDYECPYCGDAYPVVEELERVLGDRLRFAFRHFPLTQIHPHAQVPQRRRRPQGRRPCSGRCTPTFFINGVRYDGPPDFDSLLVVLAEAAGEQVATAAGEQSATSPKSGFLGWR